MAIALEIPKLLRTVPFTPAMAEEVGLPRTALRGKRFRRLFRGVYVCSDLELSLVLWLRAALLILPKDAVVSHLSALWLYGVEIGSSSRLEFSTNLPLVTKISKIVLHRRQGWIAVFERESLPVTGPDRTLVDCATRLTFVQFIQASDWLIFTGATTPAALLDYASSRHLSGVLRARRALLFVREHVESPMETLVRLMLVFARLPEPECNPDILDGNGKFLARGDMVYFRFKVLVEYDGWQHERDAKQRQRDRERRELLEANGWRVIVSTSEDLKAKHLIPQRVFDAMKDRGYEGQAPRMNAMWHQWFA